MKGLRARLLGEPAAAGLADADAARISARGERDIRVARDYYQSVIDSVASVICTVDRELCITGVNKRWDEFALANWGPEFTSDKILGVPVLSLLSGSQLKRWETACQDILSAKMPLYLDEVAREGQVAWRNYTLAASPLKNNRGEILGIVLVATNISQLKKAEAEMLKRLVEIRGFHQVAQTAGAWFGRRAFHKQVTADLAHLFSADKCIIFRWGESSGHLEAQFPAYGVTAAEVSELTLDIGDPGDLSSLWQDLEERDYILLNEGDEAPGSIMETSSRVDRLAAMMAVLRVSGRVHGAILVAGRDRPFTDQDGQLAATFSVPVVLAIEDAELHQRLLDRVGQLETMREELERISKLVEGMRMPLTVMQGYTELLLEGAMGSIPEEHLATFRMLLQRVREMADLVRQFPRAPFAPDTGRLGLDYQPVDLVEVLGKVRDQWAGPAQEVGLELRLSLPEMASHGEDQEHRGDQGPYRCWVAGETGLISSVFVALVDNAVKFSLDGGKISISLHESRGVAYIRIQDPGVGIPLARLSQIWEPREKTARGPVGSCYPISLAEVKQIVERHGGQVWVESQVGRGSTFYVVLPKLAGGAE